MTWFRFDSSALQDEKMLLLHKRHGHAGIGLYLRLICLCYDAKGELPAYKLPIVFEAHDEPQGEAMLATMVELRLFSVKKSATGEDVYVSRRVTQEIQRVEEYIKLRSELGRKGGQASAKSRKQEEKASSGQRLSSSPKAEVKLNQPRNDTKRYDNDTKQSLGEKTDSEIIKQFFDIAKNEQWTDKNYVEAKTKQYYELHKEDKEAVLKKMRVMINCSFSKSESTQRMSKKIYHETVGLIQDRALDRQTKDDKTLAKRREFAEEESGKNYVEQELDPAPF
jgi:hypothetical protein